MSPGAPQAGKREDHALHTFNVHKDAVSSLHLVGDMLFSGSYDCSVAKIDLHKGAAAHTFHGSQSMVHCVRESEGQVYVGNDDGEILVLDPNSGIVPSFAAQEGGFRFSAPLPRFN
jgi:hypothetical protein